MTNMTTIDDVLTTLKISKFDSEEEIAKLTIIISNIYTKQQDEIIKLNKKLEKLILTLKQIYSISTNTSRLDNEMLRKEIITILEQELKELEKE